MDKEQYEAERAGGTVHVTGGGGGWNANSVYHYHSDYGILVLLIGLFRPIHRIHHPH